MAFNTRSLRDITQQDIDDDRRDGVVCLRLVFSNDWIGLLPTIPGRCMVRCNPEYRRFVFESPLAQAAAV